MTARRRPPRTTALRVAALAVTLLLAGCAAPASSVTAGPTIADAWVRPPMGPGQPAAGYMTITAPSGGADALIGASSPVAAAVEIHETSTDASGMMGMRPVDRVELPSGSPVALEPGGYHLMLMNLDGDLEAGDTVDLVLEFENAGEVTIRAAIREE
jgi:copper(I)-binding protein